MSSPTDPIAALLAEARTQYAASVETKAASVEALVARGAWGEARRAAHKLRGSAATYGFAELGAAAGAIEDVLLEFADAPEAAARARLVQLVRALAAEAARSAGGAA